jgi:hypothetical protein
MKHFKINRLLISSLVIIFTGFGYANANNFAQEENKNVENPTLQILDKIDIEDVFCTKADPNRVFIILDHNDRIITQGRCNDVMVKFFLSISDPLLEVDNIKYYRLEYANRGKVNNGADIKD